MRFLAVVLMVCMLAGCFTPALYQTEYDFYSEDVSSILTTQDHQKIVLITKQYHYIFDMPPELMNTLGSELHPYVAASFDTFILADNNNIKGTFSLTVKQDAPLQQFENAAAKGYQCIAQTHKEGSECTAMFALKGKRYSGGKVQLANNLKLNQEYRISIQTKANLGSKVLLTPVTVALDGMVVLGFVTLVAISVPINLACAASACDK